MHHEAEHLTLSMDMTTHRECCASPSFLYSSMSQQAIVVGDGNITGTNLNNVSNRNVQNFNFFSNGPQRGNGMLLLRINLRARF